MELYGNTPTPAEKVIVQEEMTALERAMAQLPSNYREVIRLRYDGQLTFASIGEMIGCSSEAARKLWARAIARLEKELNPSNEHGN